MSSKKKSILGTKSYGLYFGSVESYDPVTEVAVVNDCQHVCRWYGRSGGITALAAYGICGPEADKSRIAPPAPRSTLAGIVAVHECTEEAAQSIEEATSDE